MIKPLIYTTTLLLAICFNNIAHAGTIRHDRPDEQYTSLAKLFPSVGYLSTKFTGGEDSCSATLIDPNYILTAAHCIDRKNQNLLNASFWVDDISYSVTNSIAHSGWFSSNRDFMAGNDIAVLRLATPVLDLPPATLFTDFVESGETGTYVGFGATGNGFTGYLPNTKGTKRAGENIVEIGSSLGLSNNLLLSDFDHPLTVNSANPDTIPLDLEYTIAPGDSGGGLFINGYLAGIHSFGWGLNDGRNNSSYSDIVAATRISSHLIWINNAILTMEKIESSYSLTSSNLIANSKELYQNFNSLPTQKYDQIDQISLVNLNNSLSGESNQYYIKNDLNNLKYQVEDIPEPNLSYSILALSILSLLTKLFDRQKKSYIKN